MVLLLDRGRVEHVVPVDSWQEAEARGLGLPVGATWGVRRWKESPKEWVGPIRRNGHRTYPAKEDVGQNPAGSSPGADVDGKGQ